MKSYAQLAASAYAAYCKHAQRMDTEGLAGHVQTWEQLDEGTRQCWIEATKQIVAEAARVH